MKYRIIQLSDTFHLERFVENQWMLFPLYNPNLKHFREYFSSIDELLQHYHYDKAKPMVVEEWEE